jgi:rhodanese-related sulfurtransferase
MFNKYAINVLTASQRQSDGATLLDVRTKEEWRRGHVPGSVRVSLDSIEQRRSALTRQYAGSEVLVICRSGSRSGRAAAMFRDMGISAINVRGGIDAWNRKDLPIKKGQ